MDKSLKPDPEEAMDLSNHQTKCPPATPPPARISPTSSSLPPAAASLPSAVAASNPYSLFPLGSITSSATSTTPTSLPSSLASIPSSYLLQNLLIGKMQQQLITNPDNVTTTSLNEAAIKVYSLILGTKRHLPIT